MEMQPIIPAKEELQIIITIKKNVQIVCNSQNYCTITLKCRSTVKVIALAIIHSFKNIRVDTDHCTLK